MKAFPVRTVYYNSEKLDVEMNELMGMDLRDYFAAKAMPALVINKEVHKSIFEISSKEKKPPEECLATMSYVIADAMMKAREVTNG